VLKFSNCVLFSGQQLESVGICKKKKEKKNITTSDHAPSLIVEHSLQFFSFFKLSIKCQKIFEDTMNHDPVTSCKKLFTLYL